MKIQSAKAGIGTGRAGLQAASGLFSSAGLFSKGVTTFDPLALNPYAFFDGESYKGTLENPTLDLDPSNPDSLDVITATRAGSTATYTDSSGIIQVANPNTTRVDYVQGEQLTPTVYQHIGYTDFSSGWSGIRTENEQGTNHLGFPSQLITRINESSSSAGNYYFLTSTLTDGKTYRYSLYIRRITGTSDINLRHRYAVEGSDTLVSLTEDWQRFEVSATKAVGLDIQFGITIADFGDQVEIAMPQVEEGTTASSFVANTSGNPKFITGATFGPRSAMILVEPSATNGNQYSEDATQWTGSNRTVTPNTTTAPDGNQTAATIVRTAGSGDVRGTGQNVTAGLDYSLSIFAKADTDALIKLDVSNSNFGGGDVTFNVRTGEQTAGDITKASVEVFPNGWRRFVFTPTCAVTGTSATIIRLDNDEPVQLWGFQFEQSTVATSYIPTSGSPVTRAADDLEISGSEFSSFFNGSEGTFYIEAVDKDVSGGAHAYIAGQGTSQFFLYKNNGDASVHNFDGVNQLSFSGLVSNQLFRAAASYNSSVKSLSFNGATASGNHRATGGFSDTNIIKIGSGYTNVFSGHYRRIIYWPYSSENL